VLQKEFKSHRSIDSMQQALNDLQTTLRAWSTVTPSFRQAFTVFLAARSAWLTFNGMFVVHPEIMRENLSEAERLKTLLEDVGSRLRLVMPATAATDEQKSLSYMHDEVAKCILSLTQHLNADQTAVFADHDSNSVANLVVPARA
jgi:hypothetical protein